MESLWSIAALTAMAALLLALWRLDRACRAANRIEWGRPWMNRVDGLNRIFCSRYHRLAVAPLPLPAQGAAILVSNHVSGLGAMILIAASARPLRFIIAREEYQRFGLNWLFRAIGCIPVDRTGRAEQAFREALRALRQGEVVALFPHGGIHLPADPPRPIKGGAVRMARLAGVPLQPVRIEGIAGEGRVIGSVWRRSRARVTAFPLLTPADTGEDPSRRLQAMLEGRWTGGASEPAVTSNPDAGAPG